VGDFIREVPLHPASQECHLNQKEGEGSGSESERGKRWSGGVVGWRRGERRWMLRRKGFELFSLVER
jgi:hypothetical protein